MLYILTALFVILLGREKGPEELGTFSLVFIIINIIKTINEFGYDFSLQRDINQNLTFEIADAQKTKNNIWFILILPAVLILVFSTGNYYSVTLLLYNLFYTQSSTLKSVLKGRKKMTQIPRIEGSWTLFLMLANVLCLYLFYDMLYIFIFYIVFELGKSLHFYLYVKQSEGELIGALKDYYSFSKIDRFSKKYKEQLNTVIMNFSANFQYRSSVLATGWFGTEYALGLYSAAFRFLSIFRILPGAALDALLPEFSSDKNYNRLALSMGYGALVSFLLFLPVYYFSEEIIILLLTEKFAGSVEILKIMSFIFVPLTLNQIMESYLISFRKETVINITLITTAIFVIIFSYFSISHFNVTFVALFALMGELLSMLIYILVITFNRRKEIVRKSNK